MAFEGYAENVVIHGVQLVSKDVTQQCMMPNEETMEAHH